MLSRSAAWVVGAFFCVMGCGSGQSEGKANAALGFEPCEGAACLDCHPVVIKTGLRTVTEVVCGQPTNGEASASHACVPGSGDPNCPPEHMPALDAGAAHDAESGHDADVSHDAGDYDAGSHDGGIRDSGAADCD